MNKEIFERLTSRGRVEISLVENNPKERYTKTRFLYLDAGGEIVSEMFKSSISVARTTWFNVRGELVNSRLALLTRDTTVEAQEENSNVVLSYHSNDRSVFKAGSLGDLIFKARFLNDELGAIDVYSLPFQSQRERLESNTQRVFIGSFHNFDPREFHATLASNEVIIMNYGDSKVNERLFTVAHIDNSVKVTQGLVIPRESMAGRYVSQIPLDIDTEQFRYQIYSDNRDFRHFFYENNIWAQRT